MAKVCGSKRRQLSNCGGSSLFFFSFFFKNEQYLLLVFFKEWTIFITLLSYVNIQWSTKAKYSNVSRTLCQIPTKLSPVHQHGNSLTSQLWRVLSREPCLHFACSSYRNCDLVSDSIKLVTEEHNCYNLDIIFTLSLETWAFVQQLVTSHDFCQDNAN